MLITSIISIICEKFNKLIEKRTELAGQLSRSLTLIEHLKKYVQLNVFLNSSICPPYPFFFLSLSCLNRSDGLFLRIRSEFEEVLGIRGRTVFLRDFRERSCGVKIFRCPLPHRGRRDIVPILYYFTKTDSTDDCCQMCAYSLHRGFEIIIGKSYRCERTILPVSRIFIPMFC